MKKAILFTIISLLVVPCQGHLVQDSISIEGDVVSLNSKYVEIYANYRIYSVPHKYLNHISKFSIGEVVEVTVPPKVMAKIKTKTRVQAKVLKRPKPKEYYKSLPVKIRRPASLAKKSKK